MAGTYCLRDLLELMLRENASELRLAAGAAPVLITQGARVPINVADLAASDLHELLRSAASEDQLVELNRCGNVHFLYTFQNSARFAIHAVLERDSFAVTIKNLGH